MVDALSHGRLDVGFARAFLPHEFRRFGISMDESQARFKEGLEQVELLLTRENVSHDGQFHKFPATTSFPRPTSKPRPKFYVAATQTPETFEFAGRQGYSLMAMPVSPKIKDLVESYRAAWRKAGHPGNGEVMMAFHMFCHEDPVKALEFAHPPFDQYFEAIREVTQDWVHGPPSSNYKGYKESMAKISTVTMEGQISSGAAWIGTPDEIVKAINTATESFGAIEHASLQVNFGMLDLGLAQSSMRLFAREVMGRIRGATAAAAAAAQQGR